MDTIIKTVSKGLFPFIFLFGIFVFFHGHLTPGGSFPGGAIIASGIALIVITFSLKKAERIINEENAHIIEGFVALLLALVVLYEPFVRQYMSFGGNTFELWSAQQVFFLNVFGGTMVAMALMLIVFLLVKE